MKNSQNKEELLINLPPKDKTTGIKDDASDHSDHDDQDFKKDKMVFEDVSDNHQENQNSAMDNDQKNPTTKKKIPLHYWVLGAIVLIPLAIPLIRITEALIMLLIRIFA